MLRKTQEIEKTQSYLYIHKRKEVLMSSLNYYHLVEMSEDGVIGIHGVTPWGEIKEKNDWIEKLVKGKNVLVGRGSWMVLADKLKKWGVSKVFVLTRRKEFEIEEENVFVIRNVDEIEDLVEEGDSMDIFILGGEEVYRNTKKLCDRIYVIRVRSSEWRGFKHYEDKILHGFEAMGWSDIEVNEYINGSGDKVNGRLWVSFIVYIKRGV